MRISKWTLLFFLLLPLSLAAQDIPRFEIFGGYSHLRMQSEFAPDVYARTEEQAGLNGWNVAATVNLDRWVGIDADFGEYSGSAAAAYLHAPIPYNFKQDFDVRTYLFGPRFSYRGDSRITPFIHALFGKAILDRTPVGNTSKSSFAWAIGGGLDVNVVPHVAIRAIQTDYIRSELGSAAENNLRLSVGAVLRF